MLSTFNLARIAKVLALLLFVLPWVTVSCAEQTLITMSGIDLATGNITMTNPMTQVSERPPGAGRGDLLVIIGAVLILLALAATFILKRRTAAMAAIAGCVAGGAALAYTVLVRIPESAREGAIAGSGGGSSNPMGGPSQAQIAEMIRVNIEIGFWLVLVALAAAVVLNFMAMKSADAPAAAATPAPAPTAPPAEPPAEPPAA